MEFYLVLFADYVNYLVLFAKNEFCKLQFLQIVLKNLHNIYVIRKLLTKLKLIHTSDLFILL